MMVHAAQINNSTDVAECLSNIASLAVAISSQSAHIDFGPVAELICIQTRDFDLGFGDCSFVAAPPVTHAPDAPEMAVLNSLTDVSEQQEEDTWHTSPRSDVAEDDFLNILHKNTELDTQTPSLDAWERQSERQAGLSSRKFELSEFLDSIASL